MSLSSWIRSASVATIRFDCRSASSSPPFQLCAQRSRRLFVACGRGFQLLHDLVLIERAIALAVLLIGNAEIEMCFAEGDVLSDRLLEVLYGVRRPFLLHQHDAHPVCG